jgi:hypothetical protein
MQFVLKPILDVVLEILGDVTSMGNVTDARERDRYCESVGEGWQILLQTTNDE